MAFNVNDFKSNYQYGGARPALFDITMTNPITANADRTLAFRCRASAIPQRNVTKIPVPFFARNIKVAGVQQDYEDWNVTVLEDEDWIIRDSLETWSHSINSVVGNIRQLSGSDQSLYKSTATVNHYSQTGNLLRQYTFYGIWPTVVSPITLDWGQDEVASFECTFSVDWWTIGTGSTTGTGGSLT